MLSSVYDSLCLCNFVCFCVHLHYFYVVMCLQCYFSIWNVQCYVCIWYVRFTFDGCAWCYTCMLYEPTSIILGIDF